MSNDLLDRKGHSLRKILASIPVEKLKMLIEEKG
jgi:hypothetical protein